MMTSRSMLLTGEQIRAARALARLDQAELARRCGLSLETIKRLERIRGPVDATVRTLNAIEGAFRLAAVGFEADASGKVGVYTMAWSPTADPGSWSGPARAEGPRPAGSVQQASKGAAEPDLERLIYFSTAEPETAAAMQAFLSSVLKKAAARNAALGVTGALLACNGRFLQVLEGRKDAVRLVFGAISIDPRHHSLRVLQCRPVGSRLFADWGLCCGVFPSESDIFALEPGMADGFRPEALSPAAALGLLSVVRELQRQLPRSSCGDPGQCTLTDECQDKICVASTGNNVAPPEEMFVQ